ncbi:permease family domain-containing protein [Ditylenchus destructor]|uniref:Permease family domain-containing protein n=1 Tax=Ditylenchus destructor TaxID=166010 RepID=A0AAD4NFU0_9BILA|nr:permease family domain-containing protein [Ditylenchus destructor]
MAHTTLSTQSPTAYLTTGSLHINIYFYYNHTFRPQASSMVEGSKACNGAHLHLSDIDIPNVRIKHRRLFKADEHPPMLLTFFLGLQQVMVSVSVLVSIPFIISDEVCPGRDLNQLRVRLISCTFVVCGIATIIQSSLGMRLALLQGVAFAYVPSIRAFMTLPEFKCNATDSDYVPQETYERKMALIQGSLLMSSCITMLIGATGLVGRMTKFIGPITEVIVYKSLFNCFRTLVALFTTILYLHNFNIPLPSMSKGQFKWTKLNVFGQYPYLTAILFSWGLCLILTSMDLLPAGSIARTDRNATVSAIQNAPWIRIPFPGQFGPPEVNIGLFVAFLVSAQTTLFEAVGNYHAVARVSEERPPPSHAINRGILAEGLGCFISGLIGPGVGVTTHAENVAVIGITKVASRVTMIFGGFMLISFGVITKLGALLSSIPDPLVGVVLATSMAMVGGVAIANVQTVDLKNTRNTAILGFSIMIGMCVPTYYQRHSDDIYTGSDTLDEIIRVLMSLPMFVGAFTACILDNTVSGATRSERGLRELMDNDKGVLPNNSRQPEYTSNRLQQLEERLLQAQQTRNTYLTRIASRERSERPLLSEKQLHRSKSSDPFGRTRNRRKKNPKMKDNIFSTSPNHLLKLPQPFSEYNFPAAKSNFLPNNSQPRSSEFDDLQEGSYRRGMLSRMETSQYFWNTARARSLDQHDPQTRKREWEKDIFGSVYSRLPTQQTIPLSGMLLDSDIPAIEHSLDRIRQTLAELKEFRLEMPNRDYFRSISRPRENRTQMYESNPSTSFTSAKHSHTGHVPSLAEIRARILNMEFYVERKVQEIISSDRQSKDQGSSVKYPTSRPMTGFRPKSAALFSTENLTHMFLPASYSGENSQTAAREGYGRNEMGIHREADISNGEAKNEKIQVQNNEPTAPIPAMNTQQNVNLDRRITFDASYVSTPHPSVNEKKSDITTEVKPEEPKQATVETASSYSRMLEMLRKPPVQYEVSSSSPSEDELMLQAKPSQKLGSRSAVISQQIRNESVSTAIRPAEVPSKPGGITTNTRNNADSDSDFFN